MTTIHYLRNHLRCDHVFVYLRRLILPITVKCIIQIIKVFDIDKTAGRYFSGVLDRLMYNKDAKDGKAGKDDAKNTADATE